MDNAQAFCVECLTCGLIEVYADEMTAADVGMDHAQEDFSAGGYFPHKDPALMEHHTVRARPMTEADYAEADAKYAKTLGVNKQVIKNWRLNR